MSQDTPYKVVVATASIGMFLSTLDTGIITVALPTLGQQFDVSVPYISLAVTVYLAVLSATILFFGRLSDYYGRIRLYSVGLVVFGLGSLLCGFAYSASMLIISRAVQGIGAAMMQGIAAALITTLVEPERRGPALGTMGVMIGLGPVLGPPVGGFLISAIGWPWIFWINIPICVAGLWGCNRLKNADQQTELGTESGSIDVVGNLLLVAGIGIFVIGLSGLQSKVATSADLAIPSVGLVFLILFVAWEQHVSNPIMDLGLFRSFSFSVPLLGTAAFGAAAAISFVVPPYFLENVAHLVPWQVGLVSLFSPLGLLLFSQISGNSINRLGTGKLMLIGLTGMLLGFIGLTTIQRGWSPLLVAGFLFVFGVGGGIFQPPNIDAVMGTVSDARQGEIGSIQRMVQNLFIAIGTALSAVLIRTTTTNVSQLMEGIRWSWILGTGVLLLSLLVFISFLIIRDDNRSVSTTTAND